MGRATTPLDLWRLADQAEANGIRILREPFSNEHFATSGSDPTILYRLSHHSCSCRGFMAWGRCQHHSLFLAELGWLPDVAADEPEPDPSAPAPVLAAPVPARSVDGATRRAVEAVRRIPVDSTDAAPGELAPWERAAD